MSDPQVVAATASTPDAQQPERVPFISSANASEMAKRSWESRREKQQKTLTLSLKVEKSIAVLDAIPNHDGLIRARKQLDSAETMLERAFADPDTEAVNVERLTRAVASLREQVRILEGRPLPGARRPGPERVRREGPAAPLD